MTGSLRNALRNAFSRRALALGLTISFSAAASLQAASVTWEGDDAGDPTNWAVGGNWDLGAIPVAGDDAFINNGRAAAISSDVGFVNNIYVRGGSRLDMNAGGKVSPDFDVFIGDAGETGEYVQSGGVVDGFGGIRIGVGGGTGTARLTGGQLLFNSSVGFPDQNSSFQMGIDGTGTFNLEGGELRQVTAGDPNNGASWNYIGRGTGTATFNISGGTASFVGRTHIGDGPTQATVNQTGGVFEVTDHELIIADSGGAGSKSVYNISGGQLLVNDLNAVNGNAGNISIGHWTNSDAELNVSGTADVQLSNELHVGGGDNIGSPAKGVLNQSGGTIRAGGWSYIGGPGGGPNSGGNGTFNLSGGSFTNANRFHVAGENGSEGVINQTGGALRVEAVLDGGGAIVNTPDMLIGDGRGSSGVYNLSGGTATIDRDMLIGHWARTEGHVNVSGGELNVGQHLFVGAYTDTDAADVGVDGVLGTADDNYRSNHKGFLKITDGTVRINNDLSIASDFNSDGTVDMEGGELTVGQWTYIGRGYLNDAGTIYESNGTFNMSGGHVTFEARVGIGFGSNGTMNQTGGRIDYTDAKGSGIGFAIGDSDTSHGVYNLSGGEAIVSGGRVQIGHWHGLDAVMNVSGTGLLRTATDVHVGSESDGPANKGTLNQTGGAIDVGGNLIVAFHPAGTGDINLSAGDLHSRNNVLVGDAGLGTVTQTGGTHTVEGDLTMGVQATADGKYVLDGGVLNMTGGSMSFGAGIGSFDFTGGTLKDAGTINFSLVNNGGTLAPGASPGQTNIIGDYTVTSGAANYQVEIAGLSQGVGYDFLNISGLATLGGNLQVLLGSGGPVLGDTNGDNVVDIVDLNNVRNNFGASGLGDTDGNGTVDITDLNNVRNNFGASGGGFTPSIGDSFTILSAAGGLGGSTFATTALPSLPAGRAWNLAYLPNDVRLSVVASPVPVPEPSTLGLGCVLLAGAGWWIRRKKTA